MRRLELVRQLVAEHRLDVVGGGLVSHDEALTPIGAAAAQYEEGLRSLTLMLPGMPRPRWDRGAS